MMILCGRNIVKLRYIWILGSEIGMHVCMFVPSAGGSDTTKAVEDSYSRDHIYKEGRSKRGKGNSYI